MRQQLVSIGPVVSLIVLLLALGGTATAADVTYSFNLIGPQITTSSSGASITMTGGGSFDTTTGTVVASGAFTERDANGSVTARGTWTATGFTSFDSFGGPNPGTQGGQLLITVTLFPNGGPPQTGQSMSVTCLVNAPPGFTEGVTLGGFTTPERGRTLFHLNE